MKIILKKSNNLTKSSLVKLAVLKEKCLKIKSIFSYIYLKKIVYV